MSEVRHVRIKDIGAGCVGETVEVRGWLRNKPGGKGRYFLWLRDGSGEIQAVAEQSELDPAVWADCERIGIESSLVVQGTVRAHPKNPDEYELGLTSLTVVQAVTDYPIGKKSHGVDFLMKNRHLWLRGAKQSAILRIRSELHKAIADFMYERGFYRVDTPIFTPNACEGTTTLFEVDYHGDTVYLAQSGQLYNEADIGALGQVYCFGPTFRAEKSKTRRHLLEFWMLEMEAAYYDHFDNMRFQEELMAFMVRRTLDNCLADLRILERDPAKLEPALETPYPRVRYGETIELLHEGLLKKMDKFDWYSKNLKEYGSDEGIIKAVVSGQLKSGEILTKKQAILAGYDVDLDEQESLDIDYRALVWGEDFGAPEETDIGKAQDRPVFVTNFPVEIKGFYFKDELNDDGTERIDPVFAELPDHLKLPDTTGHTVQGSDCIGSEGAGELIGGSQREDDLQRLEAKIERHNLPREFLEWYVDLRRYGNVPHSGFGLGLERTLAWIAGGSDHPLHLREAITFPRMLHQYEP